MLASMLISVLILVSLFPFPALPLMKVLHLTDLHLDPHYRPQSSLLSFCHRPATEDFDFERAGEFGAHGCDTPRWLIERAVASIANEQNGIDLIVVTGDISRHDYDDLIPKTPSEISDSNAFVSSLLHAHFPSTPIIFCPGNNDVSLLNSLDSGPNADLAFLAEAWRIEAKSFQAGGYYAVKYSKELTVIALNTLAFSKENVLARDCTHAKSIGAAHLHWLKQQLSKKRGRFLLIGHHPASPQFFHPGCLEQYNRLLYQHRHSIVAQLAGHVHQDTMFVSQHQGIPTTPAFLAPALAPVFHPAYRVLEIRNESVISAIHQYYAPNNFSNFSLEYNTSQLFFNHPLDINFILQLRKCPSSATQLMLRRFQYVCY